MVEKRTGFEIVFHINNFKDMTKPLEVLQIDVECYVYRLLPILSRFALVLVF